MPHTSLANFHETYDHAIILNCISAYNLNFIKNYSCMHYWNGKMSSSMGTKSTYDTTSCGTLEFF